MAISLEARTNRQLELRDLVLRIERELDLRDDATLLALAPDLAALANHPTFLGEHIARELASPESFQRGATHGGRFFVLASGLGWVVRANLWEPEGELPAGKPRFLHDHDFSFLTVGYFGPGYETALYECDPARIEGYLGEHVALEPLGRKTLGPGSMLYFERRRHVHAQGTPPAPSVSLSVLALDPETPFISQYHFDERTRRIVAMSSDPYNGRALLCDLAAALGVTRAEGALAAIARTHASPGLRAHATRALATLAGGDVWRTALDDPHPLVRRSALEALLEEVS